MGWISDLVSGGRRRPDSSPPPPPSPRDVQIAPAGLLLEVSAADHDVDERESREIVRSIESAFALSADETAEIVEIADQRSSEAVSLYEFTRLVDRSLSREHKATIIELLFRVAFADGWLAGEEEQVIRKVATLLRVEHPAFIAAKLRAKG
ncbi:MAG: TerB family tellurite resistance protein [Acidobacteria bacterium]|nr:TerB family tellurite resistance protein [Acidobacteriota bacterium]